MNFAEGASGFSKTSARELPSISSLIPVREANLATTIQLNDQVITVDVPPETPLLWVLRDPRGCGIAVHPDQVIAQIEGGAVSGLINTIRSKLAIAGGRVEQANFSSFTIPRMPEVPPIEVALIGSAESPGGMGEARVPLVAPAIANAVFALTGKRIRALPLEDAGIRFV